MKRYYIQTIVLFLMLPIVSFAQTPPKEVAAALKKMYPEATSIAWSKDEEYPCASFFHQGFNTHIWFSIQGAWLMTQTDYISSDRLPPAVYNAFASGPYSNWVVNDVTYVTFPRWESIWVIRVGLDNEDMQYQLFYEPNGTLLKSRNVTYLHNILGAATFLEG